MLWYMISSMQTHTQHRINTVFLYPRHKWIVCVHVYITLMQGNAQDSVCYHFK